MFPLDFNANEIADNSPKFSTIIDKTFDNEFSLTLHTGFKKFVEIFNYAVNIAEKCECDTVTIICKYPTYATRSEYKKMFGTWQPAGFKVI